MGDGNGKISFLYSNIFTLITFQSLLYLEGSSLTQLDTPECSLDLVHDTVYDDHITTIPWTQRSALPDRTPDPPTTPQVRSACFTLRQLLSEMSLTIQVKFSDKKTSQWSFANYLVRPPVEDTSAINEPLSLDCDTEYVNEVGVVVPV